MACSPAQPPVDKEPSAATSQDLQLLAAQSERLDIYKKVKLTSDLSQYSAQQREMLSVLIQAASIMDDLFWRQAFGDNKSEFLASIPDPKVREFAALNYGPWDRLAGDTPFLTATEEKPLGAQFYPKDMTKEEFEQAEFSDKKGLYSMVQRDGNGKLVAIPYSEIFKPELTEVASLLNKAASLAQDSSFANYLSLRAKALLSNDYQPSDFAWMDMKTNPIELVIGPIETYEDQLFGYRAAFEA
ncbi:MAG: Zn-dependent hydrolase, partial [Paraglaciecola sp.]|nr:Zn-dependent hydrolase [Paraglaciecola sp.]